jgi:hypothetical protein
MCETNVLKIEIFYFLNKMFKECHNDTY